MRAVGERQGWYIVTSAGGATHVSTSPEVMRAMMPGDDQVESGEGARRVCSLVSGPGFAERHPEAIEEFVEIAQHNPMHVGAYLRQLIANIPGAELIVYEGVGHIPEVECFERFNDDVASFLS